MDSASVKQMSSEDAVSDVLLGISTSPSVSVRLLFYPPNSSLQSVNAACLSSVTSRPDSASVLPMWKDRLVTDVLAMPSDTTLSSAVSL